MLKFATTLFYYGKSFHSKRCFSRAWSPPKVLTASSSFPIYAVSSTSMMEFGNKAVLSFRGLGNNLWMATSENGSSWNSYQIPQLQSSSKPTLCKFIDSAVLAYNTTTPNEIGFTTASDPTLNSWTILPSFNPSDGIASPPAIASLGNTIYLAYINSAGLLKILKNTDLASSSWQKLTIILPPQEATAPHVAPYMFTYKSSLYIGLVIGNDVRLAKLVNNTFTYVSISSSPISMNAIAATEVISGTPEVNVLRMAIRAPDSRVSLYTFNEDTGSWDKSIVDANLNQYECSGAPSLAYANNSLILAFNSFNVSNQSGEHSSTPTSAQLIFTATSQNL